MERAHDGEDHRVMLRDRLQTGEAKTVVKPGRPEAPVTFARWRLILRVVGYEACSSRDQPSGVDPKSLS